jgi:hypothetical protein
VPPPERLHNGDTGTENLQVDETTSQKKKKEAAENLKIASNLIKKVKMGVEKMKKRKMKPPSNPHLIQNLMWMCSQYEMTDADIDETLENLYTVLITRGKTLKLEKGTQIWWNWYSLSCLYLVRSHRWKDAKRRAIKRDRGALGANIINMTSNHLVRTEGIRAVTFIAVLAGKARNTLLPLTVADDIEQKHYLRDAAHRSEESQKTISRMVADGLRGELPPPEDDFMITFPAVWLGVVTRKRSAPPSNDIIFPSTDMHT